MKSAQTVLELPEKLDIAGAAALHAALRPRLKGRRPVQIDAARVQSADTAGVQLLLCLHRTLQQAGRSVAIINPGAALSLAVEALGLGHELALTGNEGTPDRIATRNER